MSKPVFCSNIPNIDNHHNPARVKRVVSKYFPELKLGKYIDSGCFGTVFDLKSHPDRVVKIYLVSDIFLKDTKKAIEKFRKERPKWAVRVFAHDYKPYSDRANTKKAHIAYYVCEKLERWSWEQSADFEKFINKLYTKKIRGWDIGSSNIMYSQTEKRFKVIDLDCEMKW